MARGWESKSVEDQQVEAFSPDRSTKRRLSAEEIQARREVEILRLKRSDLIERIGKAVQPLHHNMLRNGLADIEAKLKVLENASKPQERP